MIVTDTGKAQSFGLERRHAPFTQILKYTESGGQRVLPPWGHTGSNLKMCTVTYDINHCHFYFEGMSTQACECEY